MNTKTPFSYWLSVAPFTGFKLGKYTRPAYVGERETPTDLNALTMQQLITLSQVSDSNESMYAVCECVLNATRTDIARAPAAEVVRFVGWVFAEVERINALFGKVESKPTAQEQRAGVSTLNFGLFGLIDWYARRMGISDHDEVMHTPWLRLYKCLDMDVKRQAYDRKLQKIKNEDIKKQSK